MIPSSYVIYTSTLLGIILATFRYNYHIGNVKFSCMEGWTLYGNSCYIVVQEELSWTEANNLCASQRGFKRQNCRAANAVLHAKYYSYTTSIYNPLWSSQQPKVEYCTTNSCIYIHANFSDQINYGWKMADCSVKYPTICETFSCLEDYQYRCNDNSKCYPRKGRCDGIQECSDNSDEADCSKRRAKCGKTLFEDEANEINFEMSSAEYASCQWTIRQPVDSKIILTLVNVNIRDNDELIISGIQDSTMNATSNLQIVSNMSVAKAQYTSIGNTLTITFRSQKIDSTIVNMINIILKFSYITQGKYCFLPIIGYGSVINVTGFEMGDVLYFECHLGYQTSSGQFSLSRCNNGRWTPKPKCKLLNCGSAAALYNNAILTDYTRNLTLYSRALYSCEPGLHINGSSPPFRLCTENGTWTNPDFFLATRIIASVCYATSFAYGHFVEQFYANGTTGKYVCDEGFYQKETDPVCIYGTWKGTPYCYPEHSCYHNPCGNGTCIQLTGGYSCICYEGFRMISTSKGYICSDIDECSTPGYSLCEFTCINTIGSYECKCPDTHQLYTDPNSVKNLVSNTEFLILNRTCIEKKCTVPEIPPNVIPYPLYTDPFSYQNGLYHTDTVIYFACDHPVSNYTSLVCNKTESWVVLNPCLDEIHFFCDKPYHLNGPSSSYCIGVDKWSLTKLPDCIVRRCPGLELDGYESATHIVDTPGYSLSIICKNGEKFANGQTKILLVCMHNYTWNLNSLPACIREEDTQRNQSDDNNAMMNEYSKNCIRDTVSDVHVNMNTSAMLWCFLSANCTNITSVDDDGRYYCAVIDKNQEVLEKYPADLYVYQTFETGRSWPEIVQNSEPIKEILFTADNNDWSIISETVSVEDSGILMKEGLLIAGVSLSSHNNDNHNDRSNSDHETFFTRCAINKNWLFQQVVLLSGGCNVVEVKYQSESSLELILHSVENTNHSYLFVGIRGDVNSVVLKSVKIYAIKCPEVRVNFALFPQTAAIKDGIIVTGQCLHGAHTIIQGQNPKLFCTQHGKWIYDVQSANLCFCSSNYTSENDICVERGPICYICSGNNGTDCNDSSAVFCDRKQYCFTQITKILEGDVVRKGCTNECTASRIGCKTREETCEMCCQEDYCNNWHNMSKIHDESRFPNIDYRDVGSRVSLHYIPPNGTVVELGQPVKVTVTATDESNNSARCLFWYIGQVADCPLWPINETEYECRGSMNQRVCKRRRECTGIQFPHHVTSLKCVAGQGWSYVSTQSTAVVPMNLFRPPICLKNSADVVYLSVNLATNSSLDEPCKAALILKLHQLPKTYNAICRQLEWTFTGLLIVDNNMFANYTMRHENISTTFKCAAQIVRRIIREKLGFNKITNFIEECAPGFYSAANGCYPCPLHSYSETIGIKNCTKCPENTFTPKTGSFSSQLCRKQCPPGFFSPTGLEPCQACGIGFYQPLYGLKSCNNCTSPWTTSAVGSISASELKCKPGWFSSTGFEPCMKCPVGFYQDRAGQTTCNTCLINANNKQISINNHCEALNLCLANFCPESGECRFDGVITSCVYNSDPLAEVSRMTWLESLWKLKQQKQQRQLSNEETLKAMNDSSLLTSPIRLANTSTKLKTVSELVDKQFSVWSHNRRIRRNENKETVISTGKYSSISDQAESFISDQLASSETGTTQEWKSDLSHRAKFVTTFSPSLIKTGVHERNSIKSITTTSTVLITINATSAICSNRLNFCKNGSCVTNNHGNISCVCQEGYKINGSDNCILLQNCDYNPCGENSCKNINNEYFCQCSTAHDTFHRQKWCPSSKECDQKNLCKNNGISICDYKSQCICPTSYYGKFCTEKAEPCKIYLAIMALVLHNLITYSLIIFVNVIQVCYYGEECTAHATCIDRNINCKHGYCYKNDKTAYCKCYPGFTGSDCSIEINHCTSSPCVNGTCKPKFLGYTCICDESHKGDRCEILIDPCDRKPCNINSECRALSYGYKGKFVCNCAAGWTGKYCNELIDLCSHSQCGFGSTCITRPGVNGDIIDYCKPMNPCLHEGICQQRDDGYTCLCKPGYRGDHCQYNLCSPNPCQNGGNCTVLSLTTYNCSCPQYYGGINCTVITDACAVSNFEDYCLNDGKCISNNFEPICHCTYQYEGRRCANKKDLDFNVMFNEQSQNLTSTSFDGSILKQFTLCFWIRIISMDNNSFASFLNINQQGFAKNILSITKNVVKFGKHVGLTNMTENQWQQFCFRRKMDGTTDWIRNGEIVWERKWDISPINGSLRILLGSAQSFQAEMSMVQLYSTVVRNKQINYSIRYCKQWLQSIIASSEIPLIDWNQFTGVKPGNRNFPGICTFSECLLNPHRCSLAADKVPPKVINCPSNINITSKDRLTIVNWFPSKSNEIFAGNDIINTSSNYNSGDVFTWNIYSENVQKVAFVECETNYMPIHSVTDFYFCDLMGQWTRWPHGINFYFPSCLEYQAPLQQLSGLVTITANCRKLENANKQFNHFCTTLNCSNELKIWSNSSCKNRVLRQSANQTAESMYLYFRSLRMKCPSGMYCLDNKCIPCPENTFKKAPVVINAFHVRIIQ
ncbi:GCC2 and GCC3 family protein [Dirofilaria immitis]|nr:GCC2 and GCC3 family protein [Dirofilaria immitis]